ncbi:alanine--tRNA ligase-related protein [Deinococcus lacus]|uniref:Alanine--tRNA ligase-related protein n=1 Tax=Deinococcus lacus TaxID=392561 RepID=A0ABW1Y981_9DEIO
MVGSRPGAVALDRSAFYPEGGGQPGDRGWLRAAGQAWPVQDTHIDKGTGLVWHELVEGATLPAGTAVHGEIDALLRFRHMARHSAEHLLAQALYRVNPAFEVAAVALRRPDCTLDLRGLPGPADLQAAEALLRETLVARPLRLRTQVVPHTDLPHFQLRRSTPRTGAVRLVIFGDDSGTFDVSACGGLHVMDAAQVLPVIILGSERIRAGLTRVTFRAGPEAAEYLSGLYSQAAQLAQSLSTGVEALPERLAALQAAQVAQAARTVTLETALAEALVRAAPAHPLQAAGQTLTWRAVQLPDPALLPAALSDVPPGEVRAALAGTRCGVGTSALDAGAWLRATLQRTGGKGGGKGTLAQGVTPQPERFFAAAQESLLDLQLQG